MKILWIGSLAWDFGGSYEFPVNGPGAVSGSCFEQNIIEGLELLGCDIDILADYPYGSTVTSSRGAIWSHNNLNIDYRLPYVKLKYLSPFIKDFFVRSYVRKMLKSKDYDFIIVYLIHHPYLASLPIVKRISKNAKTVLICPDLPDMMDMSLNDKVVKRILKMFDSWRINAKYKYLHSFVLFAESMKERLPIKERPYMVLEGVSSVNNLNVLPEPKSNAVLHAGTLHKNIGIENIVEAFNYIENQDIELWIFGDGELVDFIKQASIRDKRIKYMGFVNRIELFTYIKKAKVLINARNPGDPFTKYSFPSKTFEYIYSGTPFLTTKLQGIPDEYWDYMYKLDDNTPQSIASSIKEIIFGEGNALDVEKAREFILLNKGKVNQSKKLYNFLLSI